MAVGPWACANSAIGAYAGYRSYEAWLRAHGVPDLEDDPEPEEYTPAVQRVDWEAEKRAVLRQARIGTVLLLALALSILVAVWSWLA